MKYFVSVCGCLFIVIRSGFCFCTNATVKKQIGIIFVSNARTKANSFWHLATCLTVLSAKYETAAIIQLSVLGTTLKILKKLHCN